MAYIATNPKRLLGTSVGTGQCVAFVQAAAMAGPTRRWSRGELVKGAKLAIGTAIATFDDKGKYISNTGGLSHAAIYMGQDALGIQVLDQYGVTTKGADGKPLRVPVSVSARTIFFGKKPKAVNDGRNYYVID